MSPPPPLVVLSFLIDVSFGMSGVFSLGLSLVSCTVIILGFVDVTSSLSSVILLRSPLIFICRIYRSLGLGGVSLEVDPLSEEDSGMEEWEVSEVEERGESGLEELEESVRED